MNILETKDLSYTYNKYSDESENLSLVALKDINIKIEEGQFISILGKNGSGKSTLARIMTTILLASSGTLFIEGKNIKDKKDALDIFKTIGMVFQNPDNQIVSSIVEEDVAFGPENMGLETEEIVKRVEESLESVGMSAYRYFLPSKLSGGQKQRIAIAGILATQPRCIVLDEPTSMLDPIGKKEVMRAVLDLNKNKNIAIVLITHDVEETIKSDKLVIVNEGKIVMEGSPKEIYSEKESLETYGLTVPQATLISNNLKDKGIDLGKIIIEDSELIEAILDYKKKRSIK